MTNVGQMPLVVLVNVTVTLVSQLSVAVTTGGAGKSRRHWKVRLVGTPTSTGGVVSSTVLVWKAVTVLVQSSTAVQRQIMSVGQMPLVVLVNVTVTLVSHLYVAVIEGG